MTRRLIATTASAFMLCNVAAHAQDIHEHGSSTLQIVREGNAVTLRLDAPAMDLIGFEHEAETDEQRAAITSAQEKLSDPLGLFGIPEEAGCVLEHTQFEGPLSEPEDQVVADHHDHDDDHDHDTEHADVIVEYEFTCANPAAVTRMDSAFFAAFSSARELNLQVVTENGQFQQLLTPAMPSASWQ